MSGQNKVPKPPRRPAGRPPDPDPESPAGGPTDLNALQQPGPEQWATHRLITITARLTERRLNRQLAHLKLTSSGVDALEVVAELDTTTLTELAELLCVSSQSLGKVIHRLQGLGFLTKERARDGRSANIRLTETGRAALSTAEDLVRALPEAEADAEFRRQLEHHITRLRNTEHTPLPRTSQARTPMNKERTHGYNKPHDRA
ncbi:winged helix DNA-binding protein [Arthrobacter sp. ISL-85]|uniref:MarR family winged helix-turn-helix transcriptional regulator n=1 Tax=Arthrobacter sp. ISL-85 TaxID=2819115 RepID=UPI001BE9324C|nr:MarR family transcriptional regulator [Arthrobacter sp. ISL-85]MBT2566309.1 winged helix DNA-binding protein [Arthrobacter sp. ISL-85]